jgi:hypothetical protein
MKFITGLLASVVLCASASAGEIDLSFNSDAVRAFYVHDFANRDLHSDFGFLTDSDKGEVINVSLYLKGMASDGENPLEGALGARTGYADGDGPDQEGFPLAIGGYLKYILAASNRFSIRVDAWYAPDALTLSDLEKYEDFSIRLAYNFLREADVYVGARYVAGEFDNGSDVIFDNGLNAGINIRF